MDQSGAPCIYVWDKLSLLDATFTVVHLKASRMIAPLAGPELEDALRHLIRDLKVIDGATQRVNVAVAPMALWSIRGLTHQLDCIRPRYAACLTGITRQSINPEQSGDGGVHPGGLIALLDVRDYWTRVESSLDRVTAQALGWLSVWLAALAILISLVALVDALEGSR